MAVDKKLQIFDDEGNPVDYDILANDVKFLPDGKDLPTKLAEMEAHQGDGTVKGVKMNNGSPIEPDGDGVVDLGTVITQHQDISGKVDKETGKSLMSAEEHTKLAGIEAGAEKNIIKGIKANGASTNLPVDQNGVVELPPAGSTISPASAAPSMDGTANVGSSDKYAREDHVHPHDTSKQDTLTFDDVPTAGHTTQVMSSDKIKTALDNLLQNLRIVNNEWYIGNTATGVSAQGPAGNVNISDASQLLTILVNDLTTGGAGNILSAEMGKVLKTAISTLIDSMGEYCFTNGRPTLVWEVPKCNVTQTLTDVTSNFSPSRVDKNGSLEITLSPVDNLHVFLTGDVTVEMPLGADITSTAWNESTGKVTIGEVTDDVVITAKSSTYVQSGLVFMLDAKNGLDLTTNKWKDVVGDVEFSLTNVTLNQAGTAAVFNGYPSKGVASAALNWTGINGTIESVFTRSSAQVRQPVFFSGKNKGFAMCGWKRGSDSKLFIAPLCTTESESDLSDLAGKAISTETDALAVAISMNIDRKLLNGLPKTDTAAFDTWVGILDQFAVIGNNRRTSDDSYLNGTISCIRIYDGKKLTQAEQEQNYKVDKKRFNLS